MYCIKCGAKLSDGQTVCPICETAVYHPDFLIKEENTYPQIPFESEEFNRRGLMFVITMLFLIPLILPILLELSWSGDVSWSGYVSGGTLIFYNMFVMPNWFKKSNPVIFTPITFALIIGLLLFICWKTDGNWFMTFAFPVVGGICLITCTVVTLMRYIHIGKLYIFGGAFMVLGIFMLLIEYLLSITFALNFIGWSIYPLVVLLLFGGMLIFLGINSNIREKLERRFFF